MYFAKKLHPQPKQAEKRTEKRVDVYGVFLVELKLGKAFRKVSVGYGKDLSMHGIYFKTPTRIKQNDPVEITIHFPFKFSTTRHMTLKGKVVRAHRSKENHMYHAACQLVHADPKTEEIIRQFMWWLELQENSGASSASSNRLDRAA